MADRFTHCNQCGTVTIHAVSGSGRKKICLECPPKNESHEEKMARIKAESIAWRRRMNAHKSNRRNRKASIGQADYEHENKIARMG